MLNTKLKHVIVVLTCLGCLGYVTVRTSLPSARLAADDDLFNQERFDNGVAGGGIGSTTAGSPGSRSGVDLVAQHSILEREAAAAAQRRAQRRQVNAQVRTYGYKQKNEGAGGCRSRTAHWAYSAFR